MVFVVVVLAGCQAAGEKNNKDDIVTAQSDQNMVGETDMDVLPSVVNTVYKNVGAGFSFAYPSDWYITETDSSVSIRKVDVSPSDIIITYFPSIDDLPIQRSFENSVASIDELIERSNSLSLIGRDELGGESALVFDAFGAATSRKIATVKDGKYYEVSFNNVNDNIPEEYIDIKDSFEFTN